MKKLNKKLKKAKKVKAENKKPYTIWVMSSTSEETLPRH